MQLAKKFYTMLCERCQQYYEHIVVLLANFFLVGTALSTLLLRTHFSFESYMHALPDTFNSGIYLTTGRYTQFVMIKLQGFFGFNPVFDQKVSYVMLLLALMVAVSLTTFVFYRILGKLTFPRLMLLNMVCFLIYVNPFTIEGFLFAESAMHAVPYYLFIPLAFWAMLKKGCVWKLLSVAFLILALGAYQAALGHFFGMAVMATWLKHHGASVRTVLVEEGIILLCSAAATLVNLAVIYIAKIVLPQAVVYVGVTFSPTLILSNMLLLAQSQVSILQALLSPAFFVLALVVILALAAILGYALRVNRSSLNLLFALMALLACAAAFAPQLIASSFVLPVRSIPGVWTVIVCVLIIPSIVLLEKNRSSCCQSEENQEEKRALVARPSSTHLEHVFPSAPYAMLAVLCLFLSTISIAVVNDISIDNILTRETDAMVAKDIISRIEHYEEDSGNVIESLALAGDSQHTYHYPNSHYAYIDSSSKVEGLWHIFFLLHFHGKNLVDAGEIPDSVFDRYFAGKEWDELNLDEQLVFEGHHAYLLAY